MPAVRKNKTMCIIGGAKDSDFYDAVGDSYPKYLKLLKDKKISKYLVAPETFSKEFKAKFKKEEKSYLRTLPKGLNAPTFTRITEEMVSIEIYKPSLVVIQIRNPIIAKSYLDSFWLLWENAD